MKLALPIAYIRAVTNLMLNEGEDQVPAIALSIESEVLPAILDELREGLFGKFFDVVSDKAPAVPSIPELSALSWKTEYERGTLKLDLEETEGLAFQDELLEHGGVDVKAITFEPLPTGMLQFKCTAIVRADEEGRGKLTALLKHNVKATFTKLTQKPLAEPKRPKDDAAEDGRQGAFEMTH